MFKKNVDMTQGPIWQQLAAFAIPILIGELFQQFYTMVDSIIVGNFVGRSALAAIGASEIIVKVLVGFFNGMAVGFSVLIARYFGAKDREGLNRAVNTVLQLSLLLAAIMTVGGIGIIRPILALTDTPENTIPQAVTYLTIYFGGIVFFVMYNTAAGILRAVGNVRVPLYCLFASSALNILLDLILVIVFKMGVAGVAYATIFSQAVATAISMWVLLRREANFDVNIHRYPLDGRLAWILLGMGIPTGFQKTITSFSNVLVLSHITFFGEACLAGWTVYNKIDHLLTVFAQSISSSLSTFVSQNLGAKQHQRIEKGVQVSLWVGAALFTGIIAVLVLFRGPLVRIFGSDPEMIYYAERFMLYITFFKISQLVMNVFVGALRGAGHMTLVTLLMLSGIVLFRQLYLLVITRIANNPWLVGLSYPAGWTFAATALMSVYLFHARKEWRRQSAEITGSY